MIGRILALTGCRRINCDGYARRGTNVEKSMMLVSIQKG